MNDQNPYAKPNTALDVGISEKDVLIDAIARGQKLIIYGILLYFLAIVMQLVIGPFAAIFALGTLVLGLVGIFRLGTGFKYSMLVKILLVISMLIPLVGLIVLLILNSKATKELKAAGYKVGLLGASKK